MLMDRRGVMIIISGQSTLERHSCWLSTCSLFSAIIPVQATHTEIGQGAGSTVLEEKIIGAFQVHDWQVTGRFVCVPGTGGIVLMVLDDPGGESLTLGVQVDSGREWTGDQWRLIESRVFIVRHT